ncbi:MAG: glycogen debranching enzyme N-terminal domain-containing protein, partial [Planctomycetes bacterium]|nr:glycogen debranching enzyme N-terminal domain-containing protein [Planctomycetota bacterium]
MNNFGVDDPLPLPLVVHCECTTLEELLQQEWLLPNKLGAYASSTVVGCNTRRYHGLLVAATTPPVGRIVALSTLVERLLIGDETFSLATNEFPDEFSPKGFEHLVEFRNDVVPTFVYHMADAKLVKEIVLAESVNATAIRFTLFGKRGRLELRPFVALRDFHHLRRSEHPHQMTFQRVSGGVTVQDRQTNGQALYLISREAEFKPEPQWWYRFRYRVEVARGQECHEDLYSPGWFKYELEDGRPCQLTASLSDPFPLGFTTTIERRRNRLKILVVSVGPAADQATQRLAVASDAFLVQRHFPNMPPRSTILAGYPWFADWGRDAFISLPGLLLATKRFKEAKEVFQTFAEHICDGLIPNRFDDYSCAAHYNSIDASLWFILASQRYMEATEDESFWKDTLMPATEAILSAYQEGTWFDIRADADALLTGGSKQTQLTWMDVKLGEEVITPRHGKAVEINALWYCAHRFMADRCRGSQPAKAQQYEHLADMISIAFNRIFWNDLAGCLYDCLVDGVPDPSIRPNQLFAVSLPYSPLPVERQHSVLRVIIEKLLTPFGLRTLSPDDPRYRRRYGGSWESRDRAYHQGTVWPWLMGPFIEAYLRLEGEKPFAIAQAKQWLKPLEEHLGQAG